MAVVSGNPDKFEGEDQATVAHEQPGEDRGLTVVGIGASAGGLVALQGFFDALPADTGMAFVVVTHMDPKRESLLPELLQKHTDMPVGQVRERAAVEPNHVYVIAPDRRIVITDTHLDTQEFEQPRGRRAPIDHFFRSLADVHQDCVAVILSGGGTDGAVGVKAIKEQGGLLMVQHPDEAEHESMPRAAIATGLADAVLPVAELAEKLVAYQQDGIYLPRVPEALTAEELDKVYRILTQVQVQTGHDFSQYKRSTILRRIQRRIQLHSHASLDGYLGYLRHTGGEAQALFNDLLIGVTNFFRDQEAWQALAEQVIPRLFEGRRPEETVRAWTIGCATGEEAYSVAILLVEHRATMGLSPSARPGIQVFASDLDDAALAKAREGLYPEAIEADVSPERLARFFVKEGSYYRVRRELRDLVLFANHSVLRDPPFSRLDLISCRNLLIYLQREPQQNVFEIFHYALNPERYLFLGSAESAELVHELFRTLDKSQRIYQARPWRGEQPHLPTLPLAVSHQARRPHLPAVLGQRLPLAGEAGGATVEYHLELLEELAPPSVLVDESYHVVHLSQTAGRYLRHPGGTVTADLLKLVRPELQSELRAALFQAFEHNKAAVTNPIPVQFYDRLQWVTLSTRPRLAPSAAGEGERLALVFFLEDEVAEVPEERFTATKDGESREDDSQRQALLAHLEKEVQRQREQLQATSEEYESSTEELKAANEELQSTNEEYRSAAEELETSKEELQSVNEELQTVNAELKNKLEEISRTHGDLENLMVATEIATLFLDRELRIQRYTPGTVELFNIMPSDRDRPIGHLTNRLEYESLVDDAGGVLRNLTPLEREVQDVAGRWFLARLRPYRTVDDRIDGVVLTFVDITELKEVEAALHLAKAYSEKIVGTVREGLLVLKPELTVEFANESFYEMFEVDEQETVGKIVYDLGNGQWDIPELRRLLEEILPERNVFNDYRVEHDFEDVGRRVMLLNARRLDHVERVMLAIEDITERERYEEALRQSETRLAQEVAALRRLHQMTGRVVTAQDMQEALDEILNASVELLQADFGNIQLFDQDSQRLAIVAQIGFQQPFLDRFGAVSSKDDSSCARALRSARRVVIEDVEADAAYEPYREAAAAAGYRAVQSTPLASQKGEILGVLSTHYRQPHSLSEREEQLLDLMARQAADLLERLRAEQMLEERVQERTAQVRRLASELILSEQKVRHRISQVLHDDLQQLLYAQEMQLQFFREDIAGASLAPEQVDTLDKIAEMIQTALRLTRQLTVELSPPVLKGEGLMEALGWLARHMNDLYGLQVTVDASDQPRITDEDKRILLFQIVRELLFNVVKHAEVLEAQVRLRAEDGGIAIRVEDSGKGLDVAQVRAPQDGGFGLHNARERLQLFSGRLDVRSQPGAGTQVTLYLPHQPARDSDEEG